MVGAGRLDEAWAARRRVAGDVLVTWTPAQESRAGLRWCNWLTHDLVKVECGFAEPDGKDLTEPFEIVLGPPLADTFPRVDASVVAQRARRRRQA